MKRLDIRNKELNVYNELITKNNGVEVKDNAGNNITDKMVISIYDSSNETEKPDNTTPISGGGGSN